MPASAAITQLFLTFQANVDHLEKCLGNLRRRDARDKRSRNPFLIFKDIQAEGPAPVETLIAGPQTAVAEYDPVECSITLAEDTPLDPALPLTVDQTPCGIVHAESEKVWLDSADPIPVGATVRQDRLLGSVTDLFRAFGEEWGRRWNRHQDTQVEAWQPAVATAMLDQPVPPAHFPVITPQLWRAEVRKKKATSSSGLDGVSRQDLLLLPDDLLHLILDVYAHAEATGVWPTQAMQAVITALEKRPNASRVEHYRPITIISLVYRVWSGIRAKQCLRHLLPFCDPRQNGCLPGRSAACVWYGTQACIELARRAGIARHGIVTDIIKAFNCIPRPPVYGLALLFGIPRNVVMGWQGALHLLTRRFRVRSSVGPGVRSLTGFPEGCGMSCTAAVLLGICFHRFLSARIPTLQASSYVDNLAGVSDHVQDILSASEVMQDWARAWDLQLDKTVTWSTCARSRATLRQSGLKVILDGPDLGGHMQYSLRRTNYGFVARITAFEHAWLRLGQSLAGYQPKLMAIRMAGWPSTLHGSSLVHVGARHFEQLRSQAAKALGVAGPGMNPKLLLGFVETPLADPEYYALWHSVRDLAELACREVAVACLNSAALQPGRPAPGPFGVVWARLQAVGVHWIVQDEMFSDDLGMWCPWSVSQQELQYRLQAQWHRALSASLKHRRGFEGLQHVDVLATRLLLRQYGPESQAVLRVALTGRFFTERELHHIGQADLPSCPFCGCDDSIVHRVEQCPWFTPEREQYLRPVQGAPAPVLPVQLEHAWAVRPDNMDELLHYLQEIPWDPAHGLRELPPARQMRHLFVDGSCMVPAIPQLRLASWSVVCGLPDCSGTSEVLEAGPLPTIVQTSYRAEIFAALKALQVVDQTVGEFCIWSDCAGVVARLQRFEDGCPKPRPLTNNCDLWGPVWCLMQRVGERVHVRKAPAHVDVNAAEDVVHEWVILMNEAADHAARVANLGRPAAFWQLWNKVRISYNTRLASAQAYMDFHAAAGQRAARYKAMLPGASTVHQQRAPESVVCVRNLPAVPMPKLVERWGAEYVAKVLQWLRDTLLPAHEGAPTWVSKVELFFGFLLSVEFLPPIYDARRKLWVRNPHLVAPTHRRIQWFSQNLAAIAGALGQQLHFEQKWPSSAALGGVHPCIAVVLPAPLRASIDSYVMRHLARAKGFSTSWWRSLPLPEATLR